MEESEEEEEEQGTGFEEAGQTDGGTGRSEGGGDCDQSAESERAGTNREGGKKGGKVKDKGPLARGVMKTVVGVQGGRQWSEGRVGPPPVSAHCHARFRWTSWDAFLAITGIGYRDRVFLWRAVRSFG
ncbi:hypothetical protein EYF80_034591 [Liparis tanakae]|uniref:Uncharacterized protein n=1 Tax=Liparis tanakae TaxID=230148 RepID=A0A4Z2GND8_9TELE|nr:hypothetical protein EYF80_034591 [Liparis tanakae]